MENLNLYEQLGIVRDVVDPEDHALAGLGLNSKRGNTLFDLAMRQVEEHPSKEGSKFSAPKTLEEMENRSDAETVFFFHDRRDALRIYSEGMGLGLASGEITFDPTVEEKYGVGRFAVCFAPHVREGKKEILYSLYSMAMNANNFEALPRMFSEWLDEYGALVVEAGGMAPGSLPELINTGSPSKRMQLDYKGGKGGDLSKAKRAVSRFDRAARGNASGVVDTSKAQVPVEGGKHGNKYSNPDPDPYAGDSSRRGSYGEDNFDDLVVGEPRSKPLQSMIVKVLGESDELTERLTGHHTMIDGKYYVDSNFLNAIQNTLSGFTLSHIGHGEFELKGPGKERVDFDRMRGKKFEGQVGRSHQIYDNKGGKLVKQLINAMEKAKLSTLQEDADEGQQQQEGMPVSRAVERQALKARLAKSMEREKGKKKRKGKGKDKGMAYEDEDVLEAKDGYYTVVIPPAKKGATKWHANKTVTRGAYKTEAEAEAWAKKNISGHKFTVKMYEDESAPDKETVEGKEEKRLAAELSVLLGEGYYGEDLPFLLG